MSRLPLERLVHVFYSELYYIGALVFDPVPYATQFIYYMNRCIIISNGCLESEGLLNVRMYLMANGFGKECLGSVKLYSSIICLTLFFSLIKPLGSLAESFSAQSFSYQGRLAKPSGGLYLETIDIVSGIYDPSGTCLLYEEVQQGLDLSVTGGFFAIQVGSAVGAAKRSTRDPGTSMSEIFTNLQLSGRTPSANCPAGYLPSPGDNRKLRVTVTPHSTGIPAQLAPDHEIVSQPSSWVAQTLQGLTPSDFIRVAGGISNQQNVSLATLIVLTGSGDASALHHHDSFYVKLGSALSPTNLGSSAFTTDRMGIGTSAPSRDLDFGGTQNRTIGVDRNSVDVSGSSLTIVVGGAGSNSLNKSGGGLNLSSGTSTGTGYSEIHFDTASAGVLGNQSNLPSTKMVLDGEGRLGIGTLIPVAQLDVVPALSSIKGVVVRARAGQSGNLLELQDNLGNNLSYFDANGNLFLASGPTSPNQACTKSYVDSAIAGSVSGVSSFNSRTGSVTLNTSDVTSALGFIPVSRAGDRYLKVRGWFDCIRVSVECGPA